MAGLLDLFQQDPEKQAALKQGLLNMGIQMMAGGPQDFGTSLGQGMGAGVSVYQKQLDDMRKKQAMQNVFRSAYGQPPAQSPQAPFGMAAKPPAPEAAAPASQMYGGKAPLLSMDYAGGNVAQAQPQTQQQAPEPQAPAPQFDRNAFVRAAFENPEAGYADTAMKYALDTGTSQDGRTSEIKNYEFAQSLPEEQRKAFLARASSGSVPSSVQEYEYLKRLEASGDTEGINQFYALKRATQWQDFGGYKAPVLPGGGLGAPVPKSLDPSQLPDVKAAQATAETYAKERAKIETSKEEAKVQAASNLPRVQDSANFTRKMVEGVVNHPAMSSSVGFTWTPGAERIPGTPQADFKARLDQLKGSAFLEAFANLKGGGSITETEGKKAESAINRMSTSTSENEFRQASRDFLDVVDAAERRAKGSAGLQPAKPQALPKFGEVRNGYRFIGGVNANPKDSKNWQKVAK